MNTTIETRTEALRRLAQVARESGVKLMCDTDGDYWATSVSEPGWLYRLEPDRCGCRGFATHRRCRHVAALHAHLGYLDPDSTPPAETLPDQGTCGECGGNGEEPGLGTRQFSSWMTTWETCRTCAGTGTVRIAA